MGIHDKDYMRNDQDPSDPPSNATLIAQVVIGVGSAVLIYLSLRLPLPIYFKIPVLIGIGFFLWRLWGLPGKLEGMKHLKLGLAKEDRGEFARAVYHYEKAAERMPTDPFVRVRLLAAYHSTDRVNRARDLIQSFDGNAFPDEVREELEYLVSKYWDASFRDIGQGVRLTLGKN